MADSFASRVERVLVGFDAANRRLVARLESASDAEAITAPSAGQWSPAQIGSHVAAFNTLLAGLVSGTMSGARPAPFEFVERPWADIQTTLMDAVAAPRALHPPDDTSRAASLAALGQASPEVVSAFSSLTAERAALTITHPRVGTLTLLQVGDWMIAHTIRHNAQMKRALGR